MKFKEAIKHKVPKGCPYSRMRFPALLAKAEDVLGQEAAGKILNVEEDNRAVAARWALRVGSVDDGIYIARCKAQVGRNAREAAHEPWYLRPQTVSELNEVALEARKVATARGWPAPERNDYWSAVAVLRQADQEDTSPVTGDDGAEGGR